jgi:demethylmenaquinone methyltransferase/2-methoxy-6-polyprenyl-1,4-benzoquinol methylase
VTLDELTEELGRRFARVTTNAVVARPKAWRAFRWLMRAQFDRLAPTWEGLRRPDSLAPLERALDALAAPPGHVLDLGTGTGAAALMVAGRFPDAEVVGADLAEAMVAEARANTPPELAARVRFQVADASDLPFEDASFDLVTLSNMIPFFDELRRVTAPEGSVAISFSSGPETPIFVPSERLRRGLERRGFADFADFEVGRGTALLARRVNRV